MAEILKLMQFSMKLASTHFLDRDAAFMNLNVYDADQ